MLVSAIMGAPAESLVFFATGPGAGLGCGINQLFFSLTPLLFLLGYRAMILYMIEGAQAASLTSTYGGIISHQ